MDGGKLTLMCHVDDINISHVNTKVFYRVPGFFKELYGRAATLNVTW